MTEVVLRCVLDASVGVKLFVEEEFSDKVQRLFAKLAEDLDASGDANDQAKTEANLKKLDGLIKVLETQFGIKAQAKEEHKH